MQHKTEEKIYNKVKEIFASRGYEGVSMRTIAEQLHISQSVIYHYFNSKDEMLLKVYNRTRRDIGNKRPKLKNENNLLQDLIQRIEYQMENAVDVVYILKYYLHNRENFKEIENGYIPKAAYTHVLEILQKAEEKDELQKGLNLLEQAQVITHAINGFVLEYYPYLPMENKKDKLILQLAVFIHKSLTNSNNNYPSLDGRNLKYVKDGLY